jgi:CDP-glucose 4,6-dehydratase
LGGGQSALENLVMFNQVFQGKTVWLSGHTGFKGAWLARWLIQLGARVHGFSLPPATRPSLFEELNLAKTVEHEIADVRDAEAVRKSILRVQPDFVFHLAAQPLVRLSYEQPLETYATNVMGTAHVLEALRSLQKSCAAVIVTTDKCYENREMDYAYAEEDHLGGHDPYSSSKGAAEIITSAYRRSFFGKSPVRIASARAGNVIGGGDWALDRIVPDCIRSLQQGAAIPVRNPHATRPWQHVLEPLSGYLWLAAMLAQPELVGAEAKDILTAFNFGPEKEANRNVGDLVGEILKSWPGRWEDKSDPQAHHEAKLLMLSTARAKRVLHWQPTWNFETAIARTVEWYRGVNENATVAESLTLQQIAGYESAARAAKIAWAADGSK